MNDAFRTGLRASYSILSDQERTVVKMLDMTETSKSRGVTAACPTLFHSCRSSKSTIFDCGLLVPGLVRTLDELRMDLRAMHAHRPARLPEGPVG